MVPSVSILKWFACIYTYLLYIHVHVGCNSNKPHHIDSDSPGQFRPVEALGKVNLASLGRPGQAKSRPGQASLHFFTGPGQPRLGKASEGQ